MTGDQFDLLEFDSDVRSTFDRLRLVRKNEVRSVVELSIKWDDNRTYLGKSQIRFLDLIKSKGSPLTWEDWLECSRSPPRTVEEIYTDRIKRFVEDIRDIEKAYGVVIPVKVSLEVDGKEVPID